MKTVSIKLSTVFMVVLTTFIILQVISGIVFLSALQEDKSNFDWLNRLQHQQSLINDNWIHYRYQIVFQSKLLLLKKRM
ncbi:TPA: Tar ligand binding domain-containing protein [Escherichia coli]|nr:hypothetical protein [Escherichia coli]HEI2456333.1 Tar ligand binding domain-containing protein [Escherichia coli]HEI2461202.1 Tar ligand binding domain-containing protein [Escherichia coli]HEI2669809.1 Tar ligand binding domain-containing protein [Escherichia coli]